MSKEFNALDILYVNRRKYGEKATRLFASLISGLIFLSIFVGAISIIHHLASNGEHGFFDLASRHLYAFVTGNGDSLAGESVIPFPVVVAEATFGLLASFVIAGVIAILVSRSVNPIEICDFSIIHTDGTDRYGCEVLDAEPCYEFRYFVKLQDEAYLRDAFASISIMDAADRTVGRNSTRTLFKYEEHYNQIRGVRFLSVPLSVISDDGTTLSDALQKYITGFHEELIDGEQIAFYRYIAVARVGGVMPNGEQVSCVRFLKQNDLVDGCKFASIRHTTCTGDSSKCKKGKYIYFRHFNFLYPCLNGCALGFPWHSRVRDFLLEPTEIRPSFYDRVRNITRRNTREQS